MGSDRSRDTYRGFMIPDPRSDFSSIWAAQSTYTQAGPKPGVPVPSQDTDLVLSTSGEQTAGTSISVQSMRAGLPGLDTDGAGFVWRYSTDSTSTWRGWDAPISLSGWESVVWTDGTELLGTTSCHNPHAISLPDGTVLCAYDAERKEPPGGLVHYEVRIAKRDPATGAWSHISAVWTTPALTYRYPCLLVLPSGRVLLYYWVTTSSGDQSQISCSYSYDSGSTWTIAQNSCLPTSIPTDTTYGLGGYTLDRIRVAYRNGQHLMCVGVHDADSATDGDWDERTVQYCSVDGYRFFYVGMLTTIGVTPSGQCYFDLLTTPIGFVFLGIKPVTGIVSAIVLSSADTALSSVSDYAIPSTGPAGVDAGLTTFSRAAIAACVDDTGICWALFPQVGATSPQIPVRSTDGGRTWETTGNSWLAGLSTSSRPWWADVDVATYPTEYSAVCQRGRILVLHRWAANPGDEDYSLGCAYLGGYTSVTMPTRYPWQGSMDQVTWTKTWLPYDLPDDMGWTAAGAGTAVLASGFCNVTTAANTKYWYVTPAGTIAEGILIRGRVIIQAGAVAPLTDDFQAIQVVLADGTHEYNTSIRFSEAAYRVWDNVLGAQVGADYAIDTTDGVDVLIAVSTGVVRTWIRASNLSEDRKWNVGPAGALTDDSGAPAASSLLKWGHLVAGTCESDWSEFHYCSDEYLGIGLAVGQTNPDDLQVHPYSISPSYVAGGVSLQATDGPTVRGEIQTISSRYEYGIERVFPEIRLSPRIEWRSTGDGAQETVAILLNSLANSAPLNDVIGIGLFNINAREYQFQGKTIAGAWTTLRNLYSDLGLSGLKYARQGQTIIPGGTAGTNTPYLHYGEMVGGYFVFDSGDVRKITQQTEGWFGPGPGKRATLIIEGDASSLGTSGASGAIRAPSMVGILKLDGAEYQGYRLLIPAQATYEDYFKVGTMVIGPLAVFGTDYSWGRSLETEANWEEQENPDWTGRVKSRAPARRTIEVGWVDGVETTGCYAATSPDYLLGSAGGGAEAVASVPDTPWLLEGLIRRLEGPKTPVVYLPLIPKAGNLTLNRRFQFMLGQVISPLRIDTVQGEEGSTELVRVPNVTIREVV